MFFSVASAAGVIDDAPRISEVLTNVLVFLLSIVGVLAILSLGIAGFFYFFAAGNRRELTGAKRIVAASIIGLSLALGAWVLVQTLVKFFL